MKTIKVTCNIWGNYYGFIGKYKTIEFSQDFDAKLWLCQQLATGKYKLSNNSVFNLQEIEYMKQFI